VAAFVFSCIRRVTRFGWWGISSHSLVTLLVCSLIGSVITTNHKGTVSIATFNVCVENSWVALLFFFVDMRVTTNWKSAIAVAGERIRVDFAFITVFAGYQVDMFITAGNKRAVRVARFCVGVRLAWVA